MSRGLGDVYKRQVTAKVGMIKLTEMLGHFSFWDLKDN